MKIDHLHLSALVSVLRTGSFDRAAQALFVTPSAISQRIRALEEIMGTVLIVRDTPCRPTTEGEKLYRHALQVELLESDLFQAMQKGEDQCHQSISVAVNADSLATWFLDAMEIFHDETGAFIDIHLDDQGHTAEWLKEGRVLAAVTSVSKAVQGCEIKPLGVMQYVPMASPKFMKKYFPDGLTRDAFIHAPMLVFSPKDRLQHDFMKNIVGRQIEKINPPHHTLPSSHNYQDAVAMGLGWGMAPELLARPYIKANSIINMAPGKEIDVPLYWQSWRLSSPTLDALSRAVKIATKKSKLN